MALRTASRLGVTASLRAARLPLDLTARALGRTESGLGLAVDRFDARVRAVAGLVLGDADLKDDAARRHTATDERVRALRLRERADDVEEQADERLAEKEQRARRRRADAATGAEQRKAAAERERQEREARAAKSAQSRRANVERTKERQEEAVERRARESRLDALEEKAEALEEQEEALVAADEADRLARAAAKAKRSRKSNGAA